METLELCEDTFNLRIRQTPPAIKNTEWGQVQGLYPKGGEDEQNVTWLLLEYRLLHASTTYLRVLTTYMEKRQAANDAFCREVIRLPARYVSEFRRGKGETKDERDSRVAAMQQRYIDKMKQDTPNVEKED